MPGRAPTWQERLRADGMRPVFHALTELEAGADAQPLLDRAAARPWMRELAARVEGVSVLHRGQPVHRPVPVPAIVDFFRALGCRPVTEDVFEPALHEIVGCDGAADTDHPVEVVEVLWPALLVGELVFTRAGVRVRAGRHHAVPGVADRSTLHWEYWRRHRTTSDGSFWWGRNSQWGTELRRDYVTDRGNVFDLDALSRRQEVLRARLRPPAERGPLGGRHVELIKNRCLLTEAQDPEYDYLDAGIDERF